MAGNANAGAVYAGIAQDLVTGTILSAPYGTPLPTLDNTFFEAALDAAFLDSGFVGEKGLTSSTSRKFFDVKDMNGTHLDSVQNEFDGMVKTTFLELNQNVLSNLYGAVNVTATAATTTAGGRTVTAITGEAQDPLSWIFRMKNGLKRVAYVIPRGRLTDQGDIPFTSTTASSVDVTIKAIPVFDAVRAKSVSMYMITDDGIFALSLVPTIATALPTAVAAPGLVTITGSRFTGVTGATGVKFGATNAAAYTIVNDSIIVAEMPAGSAGAANITVTNPSGTSAAKSYTRGA